jgi:bifunctional non-homologous end joining protein LigD
VHRTGGKSLYRGGPSRNWLKTKNMVESELILLGTETDDSGIPWALLAREQDGELQFAGPAIIRPPSHARAERGHEVRGIGDRETGFEGG